jgi:hypothetical protein
VLGKDELVALGYSEMAIECFHDTIVELIESLFTYSRDTLLAQFQEDGQSDYYTWFMRLLTAGTFPPVLSIQTLVSGDVVACQAL